MNGLEERSDALKDLHKQIGALRLERSRLLEKLSEMQQVQDRKALGTLSVVHTCIGGVLCVTSGLIAGSRGGYGVLWATFVGMMGALFLFLALMEARRG